MKKFTLDKSMVLSLAMLAASTSLWAQSFTQGPLKYEVGTGNEVTVSNADKDGNTGVITVPATIEHEGVTYTVTSVAKEGFKYSRITGIELPSTLTTIGEAAFAESKSLKSVVIPKSVKTLGANAFEWAENIETLTFEPGSAVTMIDHHTFKGLKKITELEIPKSVTSIGSYSFEQTGRLETLTFEAGSQLTVIKDHAFVGLSSVSRLELPEGLTTIEYWAFENAKGIETLILPSTLSVLQDGCFANCVGVSVLKINATTPPSTNGQDPFKDNFPYSTCALSVPAGSEDTYKQTSPYNKFTTITSGEIAEEIKFTLGDLKYKSIADDEVAVVGMATSATNVVVPATIAYEGKDYKVTSLNNNAFNGKNFLKSIQIPVGVKNIGTQCFYDCNGLTEITLPEGLETLGTEVFRGTGIHNFVIPNTVTSMGNKLFPGCTQSIVFSKNCPVIPKEACVWSDLAEIIIPEGVTTMCEEAFVCNGNVKRIMLPTTLTTLQNKVFGESDAITSVTCAATVAPTGGSDNTFSDKVYAEATLTVPTGSKGSYEQTAPWNKFANIVEADIVISDEFVVDDIRYTLIDDKTVKIVGYNGTATSLTIPNAVKRNDVYVTVVEIGESAFANSTIKSVEISQNIKAIGSKAFAGITLTSVKSYPNVPPVCAADAFSAETYAGAVLTVGAQCKATYSAAEGWKNFTNVAEEIEVGNTIAEGSFVYTILEDQCVSVGYAEAAIKNPGVTEIIVPEEVTYGGVTYTVIAVTAQGFKQLGCPGEFAEGENHIKDCTGTITVTLPETIEELGDEAFTDAHIKSINLPASLTTMGKACLQGTKLEGTLVIPAGVTDLPENALSWTKKLNKVVLSEGVETIGQDAFFGSTITEITLPSSLGVIDNAFVLTTNIEKVNIADLEAYLTLSYPYSYSSPFNASGARLYCDGKEITEIDLTKYDFSEISDYLFQGCVSLETLVFPETFVKIGYKAFSDCPNIKSITCFSEIPVEYFSSPYQGFHSNVYSNATLYIPEFTRAAYMSHSEWGRFENIVEMDEEQGGIDEVNADNNGISVDGDMIANPLAKEVMIYDVTGRVVYAGNDTVIKPAIKGLAIVRCDGASIKVVL